MKISGRQLQVKHGETHFNYIGKARVRAWTKAHCNRVLRRLMARGLLA